MIHIKEMDCPSEEQMLRMALQDHSLARVRDVDFSKRTLTVVTEADVARLWKAIESCGFSPMLVHERDMTHDEVRALKQEDQHLTQFEKEQDAKVLWKVLVINAVFFVLEALAGWLSGSMGLLADSLDMGADAIVYGLSLIAVYAGRNRERHLVWLSGGFQAVMACLGGVETLRRVTMQSDIPDFTVMISVSLLALAANVYSLYLLSKASRKKSYMMASWIFTSNDIIANGGIMISGVLVLMFDSRYPDLIVGGIIFAVVFWGAIRIFRLKS